jgi:anti-sigma B factor antagonist
MELITRHDSAERTTIVVAGELDMQFADELRQVAADADRDAAVALDLSQVSFIDSRGLSALIQISNALESPKASLTLISPSRSVRRILQVTGLTSVFTITD